MDLNCRKIYFTIFNLDKETEKYRNFHESDTVEDWKIDLQEENKIESPKSMKKKKLNNSDTDSPQSKNLFIKNKFYQELQD